MRSTARTTRPPAQAGWRDTTGWANGASSSIPLRRKSREVRAVGLGLVSLSLGPSSGASQFPHSDHTTQGGRKCSSKEQI